MSFFFFCSFICLFIYLVIFFFFFSNWPWRFQHSIAVGGLCPCANQFIPFPHMQTVYMGQKRINRKQKERKKKKKKKKKDMQKIRGAATYNNSNKPEETYPFPTECSPLFLRLLGLRRKMLLLHRQRGRRQLLLSFPLASSVSLSGTHIIR